MRLQSISSFKEKKIDRIQAMLEQVILDIVLSVLDRITEKHTQLPQCICYKSDCHMRDPIPF